MSIEEIKETMAAFGPKSVKTKEFEAEQFDPEKILKLLHKQSPHPTFNNMVKVQAVSNRALEDCGGGCENP